MSRLELHPATRRPEERETYIHISIERDRDMIEREMGEGKRVLKARFLVCNPSETPRRSFQSLLGLFVRFSASRAPQILLWSWPNCSPNNWIKIICRRQFCYVIISLQSNTVDTEKENICRKICGGINLQKYYILLC